MRSILINWIFSFLYINTLYWQQIWDWGHQEFKALWIYNVRVKDSRLYLFLSYFYLFISLFLDLQLEVSVMSHDHILHKKI